MNRDDQILSLLKDINSKTKYIEGNATKRDAWYRDKLEACEKSIAKLHSVLSEEVSAIDKRIEVDETLFKSFKAETRRETVITRWGVAAASVFTIGVCAQLVSWYAKQPPQDVNPVAIAREITKSR